VDAGTLKIANSSSIDSWPDFDAVVNIDAEGGVKPAGTYQFGTTIDLTTSKRVRLRSEIDLTVLDLYDNFDLRPGDIDSWANFDGPDGAEIDCVMEVRTTPDDPAGAPVWSGWGRVDAHEVQARGIQARAVLTSADPSLTPVVSKLRLHVDEVI
jgi:hypothetical protein